MSTMAEEVVRALVVTAPAVLGKKKRRKLLSAMHQRLARLTPENGVGPVIGARREALQFLESAMRVMGKP